MKVDFRSCGSSAQSVYTSQNIVSFRCWLSFYPYSKTKKTNFRVSGTQTFGKSQSVFNNLSLNLSRGHMSFEFVFSGSGAKLVYTSQNIAADKMDRIISIIFINCINRNIQAYTRMDWGDTGTAAARTGTSGRPPDNSDPPTTAPPPPPPLTGHYQVGLLNSSQSNDDFIGTAGSSTTDSKDECAKSGALSELLQV